MQRIAFLLNCLGLFLSGCSTYGPSAQPRTTTVVVAPASVTLSSAHVAMIRAYYTDPRPGRGRGRDGGLPPGIAKNLQRGKTMPPGITKQYLPSDLLVRLPSAPDGFEYVIIAGKLLLVEIATQIVRDVLLDAVFG